MEGVCACGACRLPVVVLGRQGGKVVGCRKKRERAGPPKRHKGKDSFAISHLCVSGLSLCGAPLSDVRSCRGARATCDSG